MSNEEILFQHYVDELKREGWLNDAKYQPIPFQLSDKHEVHAYVDGELTEIKLANEHIYTADWRLDWSKKAEGVFCWKTGGSYEKNFYPYRKSHAKNHVPFFAYNGVSYVDVKGSFVGRSNSSGYTFPVNQKWTLKEGTFVQKIVVSLNSKGIFSKTFTPEIVIKEEVYKTTREGKWEAGESKLKYEPLTLTEWLTLRGIEN